MQQYTASFELPLVQEQEEPLQLVLGQKRPELPSAPGQEPAVAMGPQCPEQWTRLCAAGKPPNFSPRRTIDEIRRHALSIPAEEFAAVKGLPTEWSVDFIRDEALHLTELADKYIMSASPDLVGVLALNKDEVPIEVPDGKRGDAILRMATDEPEVMPAPPEFNAVGWNPAHL
jgi:hypothetical protein